MDLEALIASYVARHERVEVSVMRDHLTPPGVEEELGLVFSGLMSANADGTYHSVYLCRGMTGPNREAIATSLAALWNAATEVPKGVEYMEVGPVDPTAGPTVENTPIAAPGMGQAGDGTGG